jgi:RNA polymerase sigma factor (sigma-70 family)
MASIITNYTTYDQAYYYADLKGLPRLSETDRQALIADLSTTDDPCQISQVKQHLMESYLHFAKHYAIELCYRSRYHRDLPDLIGIANLTVVEVISRTDLTRVGDLASYLAAYIKGRLKEATINDGLIPITTSVRSRAWQRGEGSRFEALDHLLSLDEQMEWFETDDLEEPPAMPLLPTEAAPERDPAQRAQVERWLSYLSPHAQAVLRLRYGLSDDNERCHSTAEIVRLLGIRRTEVQRLERDALTRLRALAEGKATLTQWRGQTRIADPAAHTHLTLSPEQEAALTTAYADLKARGVPVTGRALAQAAGVGQNRAQQFLRQYREQFPDEWTSPAARHQQRLAHVAEVHAELVAQGQHITPDTLVIAAHVRIETVLEFLHAQRSQSHEYV